MTALRTLAGSSVVALLAGCASPSPDAGLAELQTALAPHLKQALALAHDEAALQRQQARVEQLLNSEMDADAAVQVALLNNRTLQAQLSELGISEADIAQAATWPNPGLTLARTRRGDEVEIERGLHINLARLLLRPWTQELDTRRRQQVQGLAAQRVLSLAGETRKAWVMAVAADESLRYALQVMQAAQAGAELARRMATVGNFNALQAAREQAFAADAVLQLARAQQLRTSARERLTRLLGLWGEQINFRLPTRLPSLPTAPREQPDIERLAMAQRLDVQAARQAAADTARSLGLSRGMGFINVLELGALRHSSNQAPTLRGWELTLELPIFDWGQARVARAQAVYMQSLHQAAATAINARSEVREAYGQYRTAWDIAQHQFSEVVPLRQRISQENLLRYNGMLIGVFELLADTRMQIASVNGAIEALRDFWLAQADLDAALLGKPGLMAMPSASPSAPAAEPAGH